MTTRYINSYDPDTDFDRWHTIATSLRIVDQIVPGQSVLELGCATGMMTKDFSEAGAAVVAVDRAQPYLDRARARVPTGVQFELADITTFGSAQTFDHVVATNVLHEVPDPAEFLRNCRRLLGPSGILHMTLQNPQSLHRLLGVEMGLIANANEISKRGQDYDTLRMLDSEALVELFSSVDLEVVTAGGVLLKPLPNAKMLELDDSMIRGLIELGNQFPNNCSMNYFGLRAADRRVKPSQGKKSVQKPESKTTAQPKRARAKAGILSAQSVPDTTAPHLSLWNTEAFYGLRQPLLDTYTRIDHTTEDRGVVGSLVGSVNGKRFVSGASAPMGGIDLVRSYEPVGVVEDLLAGSLKDLVERGVDEMEVRLKGPHFSPSEPGMLFGFLKHGFEVVETNLNFFVDLRPFSGVEDYYSSLKKPGRRAIDRGEKLGLSSTVLDVGDDQQWSEAYDVLEANRTAKGRPTSLTKDYVLAIRDAFPGLVRMLAVHHDNDMVASALVYRVAAGRDVVQFWGDAHHQLPTSPMNFLVQAVVDHGLTTGCDFLDLGISTDHGQPNHGLIQFKRSIGASSEIRMELQQSDLRRAIEGHE